MNGGSVWEIEEEEEEEQSSRRAPGIPAGLGSSSTREEDVYVAVGKKSSSMDALSWALKHAVKPSTFVYLVHVFPEVQHIPTPLGMLPKNQVSPQQVESYMSQERSRRIELLQKFLNLCQASKVIVDTVLIESDQVAKAVVDLIPVLHVKKMIVGTSKSSLRKMKKGSTKAEQIYKGAPHYCDVKIICDGKEVTITNAPSSPSSDPSGSSSKRKDNKQANGTKNSLSCMWFGRKSVQSS